MSPIGIDVTTIRPRHFRWDLAGRVATVTLNRPERKNPLTFESYGELTETFRVLSYVTDVRAVVVTGAGENFSSGGDVHEIIGPLVQMKETGRTGDLLAFTRMTGDLVKAMRHCPQPIVAAIDGVCAGAGAAIALASDIRLGEGQKRRSQPRGSPVGSWQRRSNSMDELMRNHFARDRSRYTRVCLHRALRENYAAEAFHHRAGRRF